MLIDEGDRFRDIPLEELPAIPPPEKIYAPPDPGETAGDPRDMIPQLLLGVAGLLLGLFLTWLLWERLFKRNRSA
jgi:hypothetical protein